ILVLGKLPGNDGRVSFSIFRIRKAPPDFVSVEVPVRNMEEIARHPSLLRRSGRFGPHCQGANTRTGRRFPIPRLCFPLTGSQVVALKRDKFSQRLLHPHVGQQEQCVKRIGRKRYLARACENGASISASIAWSVLAFENGASRSDATACCCLRRLASSLSSSY